MGGTFDILHKGHEALLARAFESGETVIIGVTSDEFARESGKHPIHSYEERSKHLSSFLRDLYPHRDFRITKLDRTFGPGMFTSDVQAIAVSSETVSRVEEANRKRRKMGLGDLAIEAVPMTLASDGKRISTTRIRAGEIDSSGNVTS